MGLTLERDDLDVESLVPEALRDVSLENFLTGLPEYDDEWAERTRAARSKGATLQYVGRLSDGRIRVAVEEVPSSAPFGLLSSTDNLFEFQTARYHEDAPLSVRGPGAGPEVTAAGVLADVLAAVRDA
jgi:aspartokinase/homoserine dehydrogenase 1